jgi:glucose-1-phosphate thymidylyltransferase
MDEAKMDKAVIMARGLGMRMRATDPQAHLDAQQEKMAATGVKALMPIDRPFLDYALGALAEAGYRRVCLVIGPEHDQLRRYCEEELDCTRLQIEFAIQQEPRGTADAVLAVENFAAGDAFVVVNSDNYYPLEALAALRQLAGPAVAAFARSSMLEQGNIPAERLLKFAVIEQDERGNLQRIIEKPSAEVLENLPGDPVVGMNCWRFDTHIFAACRAIKPSPRHELELPDAVQYAIDHLGVSFAVQTFAAAVLDLSNRGDVESISHHLQGVEVKL